MNSLKLLNVTQKLELCQRFINTSFVLQKAKWKDDTQVVLISPKNIRETIQFSELIEKAVTEKENQSRSLVNIVKSGESPTKTPIFRLLKDNEFETLLRKNRTQVLDNFFNEIDPQTLESKRIHERTWIIPAEVSDQVLEKEIKKARKELAKGNFVQLKIKTKGIDDIDKLEKRIKDAILGDLEHRKSRLFVKRI